MSKKAVGHQLTSASEPRFRPDAERYQHQRRIRICHRRWTTYSPTSRNTRSGAAMDERPRGLELAKQLISLPGWKYHGISAELGCCTTATP